MSTILCALDADPVEWLRTDRVSDDALGEEGNEWRLFLSSGFMART